MTSQSRKQASQPFLPERSDHRLRLQVPRPAAPADGFHQNKGGFTDVCYQYHSEYLSAGSTEQREARSSGLLGALVRILPQNRPCVPEKVEVIPTLILYKGGKAVDSIVAPDSKAAIDRFLKEALSK